VTWTAVDSIVTKLKLEGRPPRAGVHSVPAVETTIRRAQHFRASLVIVPAQRDLRP
jgi:hypothetical protein